MSQLTNIASFIKSQRKLHNLTQEALAEKAGVGLRFIRDLEQGKETLRMDKVNQVLALFGHRVAAFSEKLLDPYDIFWNHYNRNVEITLKNRTKKIGFLIERIMEDNYITGWRFVSNNNAIEYKRTEDRNLLEEIDHADIDSIENRQ